MLDFPWKIWDLHLHNGRFVGKKSKVFVQLAPADSQQKGFKNGSDGIKVERVFFFRNSPNCEAILSVNERSCVGVGKNRGCLSKLEMSRGRRHFQMIRLLQPFLTLSKSLVNHEIFLKNMVKTSSSSSTKKPLALARKLLPVCLHSVCCSILAGKSGRQF